MDPRKAFAFGVVLLAAAGAASAGVIYSNFTAGNE